MKKIIFIVFYFFATFLAFSESQIILEEKCSYKQISLFENEKYIKQQNFYEELYEDMETLCYILSVGYAGYEEMVLKGFNINSLKNNFINAYKNLSQIDTKNFIHFLKNELAPFISDSHFQIIGKQSISNFIEKKTCYWTDVFVEKQNQDYFSIYSNQYIPDGLKYNDNKENLFFYPTKGNNIFRIGIISSKKQDKVEINFSGKNYNFITKDDNAIEKNTLRYKTIETNSSSYIALNTFYLPFSEDSSRKSTEKILNKFIDCGAIYKDKKNIILDLRSNQGGNAAYPASFLYKLYSKKRIKDNAKLISLMDNWFVYSFSDRENIISPVSCEAEFLLNSKRNTFSNYKKDVSKIEKMKKDPLKIIEQHGFDKSKLFKDKSSFNGKLLIIVDRNTMSAGELVIPLAKKILGNEQVITIGENTYGAASYWKVITLELPNSKIGINTTFSSNKMIADYLDWHGEGYGFFPDYWATGSDLNEAIYLITNDDEMKEKLKNIEFRLL